MQRHAVLTVELAELTEQRQAAATRQTAAQAAADAIARLTEQVREAELIAAAATATSTASTAAHTERARLCTENDSRTAAVAALEDEAREATEAQAVARDVTVEADAAVESADQALVAAQQRAETARSLVDDLGRREETQRLAAKLTKIDAALSERDEVAKELSTIALTDDLLRQIEQAAAAVERTESQLALVSATVEFVAAPTSNWSSAISGCRCLPARAGRPSPNTATEVEIPGIVTARVTPGTSALDIQAQYAAAQEKLAAVLAAAQVADLAAARQADQRRRELQSVRDQLTATLAGLSDDDDVEQLRSRLAHCSPNLRYPTMSTPALRVPNSSRRSRPAPRPAWTAKPIARSRRWR